MDSECVADNEVNTPVNPLHEVIVGKSLDLGLVSGSSSPDSTMIKGRGLRKWRRIKREVTKDGVISIDSSKLLKRGLSNPGKQKSEGSVSSTNAIMKSPGVQMLVSENSEGHSSKSSKSVTGPKVSYDEPLVMGELSDKNMNTSVKTSKKARGPRFKSDKENPQSSIESDSRSSNFVFVKGINSIQNGGSMNYNENQRCSKNEDPWSESILLLQSAQEALEKEIQEFREVGKGDILLDDLTQNNHLEELKENINDLENKLNETTIMLQVKESELFELEGKKSSKLASNLGNQEIESEFETLFKLKIEAEIEYLVISKKIENLGDLDLSKVSIMEEQKKLMLEQSKMLNKVEDVESKAVNLKIKSEKLEDYYENIEVLKLQTSVCKYTMSFVIQFILLAIILFLFVESLSQSPRVKPT